MDEPQKLEIKIRPIEQKAQKRRLPVKIDRVYPKKLLVVFVHAAALESLRRFAASDLTYELGGVLLGKVGKASRRMFVEIVDFIPAHKGVSRRASFEFTNEAQQHIHETHQSQFKQLQIVGWFHTHPGYGVFLSSADQFIDQNYFKEKYHVAVVLDPTGGNVEAGVFAWNEVHERVRVPFFEV